MASGVQSRAVISCFCCYCCWPILLLQTVALSNITIFCGAIANAMFNLPRKHPFKPGPLIDYDLLLLVSRQAGRQQGQQALRC